MQIIVGLGNPGVEYAGTRHNAGVFLVEVLGSRFQGLGEYGWRKSYGIFICKGSKVVLVKTRDYFMNESGNLIHDLTRTYNLEPNNLYVAHDDLDLRLGEFKIQFGKGPKDHHGVESVEQALGTKDFWRIRIGIDNRTTPIDGETYVLQKFTPEEKVILDNTLDAIVKAINTDEKPDRQK